MYRPSYAGNRAIKVLLSEKFKTQLCSGKNWKSTGLQFRLSQVVWRFLWSFGWAGAWTWAWFGSTSGVLLEVEKKTKLFQSHLCVAGRKGLGLVTSLYLARNRRKNVVHKLHSVILLKRGRKRNLTKFIVLDPAWKWKAGIFEEGYRYSYD